MNLDDASVNAMLLELQEQRAVLGNRAAKLAASNAVLSVKLGEAEARIKELEKKEAPQ